MEPHPERNVRPYLKAIGMAFGVFVALNALAAIRGGDLEASGELTAPVLLAGVLLGFWAHSASRRWDFSGYLWRLVALSLVVSLLGAVCYSISQVSARFRGGAA